MHKHRVCRLDEFPDSGRMITEINGKSIGIFRVDSRFFAVLNVCPHQFAPLCQGRLTGTNEPGAVGEYRWNREGFILRCPWHAWEFDIATGRSVFDPEKVKARIYQISVESESCQPLPDSVETFVTEVSDSWVCVVMPAKNQ